LENATIGRPTLYSEAMAEAILTKITAGMSLREVCRDSAMPDRSTVTLWIAQNREDFSGRYVEACKARAWLMADELVDISDDSTNDYMLRQSKSGEEYEATNPEAIARSRLRVDTRKWILSKLLTVYADKPEPAAPELIDKVIEVIRATKPKAEGAE